jgi:hypothetical protein
MTAGIEEKQTSDPETLINKRPLQACYKGERVQTSTDLYPVRLRLAHPGSSSSHLEGCKVVWLSTTRAHWE